LLILTDQNHFKKTLCFITYISVKEGLSYYIQNLMQTQFFIYGALSFPDVQNVLLGKELTGKQATLNGFEAVKFVVDDHFSYSPVLREDEESDVEGILTSSINSADLKLIQKYAGDKYKLKDVYVIADGEIECATTFMPIWSKLELGPHWDREVFESRFLREYTQSVAKGV
jgi:hypothetical protein